MDTDRLIEEKTGMSIPSYVSRYGWRDFRRVESEVVQAAALEDNSVIATGGGVVMDPENVRNLRQNGWVVWLEAGAAAIRKRMARAQQQGNFRPPLSETDPLEEVDSFLRERMSAYERASDYRVNTEGRSPSEVKQAIMRELTGRHTKGAGGPC